MTLSLLEFKIKEVKQILRSCNLSEIARRSGVSRRTIYNFLEGKDITVSNFIILEKIASEEVNKDI